MTDTSNIATRSMPDPGDVALAFEQIDMTFPDGTHVLDGVSFSVRRGEFVAVVGPSGCGKSTLLRIASGLETPTGGAVTIDPSNIGYVFQDATLLDWRTVVRNVELLGELHGMDKAQRRQSALDAIEKVGLSGFEDHYPRALSGGMKMRASIARSLTTKPPVFLFDEPFGALDEITRERLNDELQDLFVSERFAGVFITHSIAEAVFLSTRVIVLSNRPGQIAADIDVPFPYPRPHDLRFEPEFSELSAQVSSALRGGH